MFYSDMAGRLGCFDSLESQPRAVHPLAKRIDTGSKKGFNDPICERQNPAWTGHGARIPNDGDVHSPADCPNACKRASLKIGARVKVIAPVKGDNWPHLRGVYTIREQLLDWDGAPKGWIVRSKQHGKVTLPANALRLVP